MPELPEVETLKSDLKKFIVGKLIKRVIVLLPKIVSLGPETVSNIRLGSNAKAKKFVRLLLGQKIISIDRRAKMLIFRCQRRAAVFFLLIHLKMTGQLIFAKKGQKKFVKIFNADNSPMLKLPHKFTHVIFEFTDGSRLYFNDLRQFGYLRLVSDHEFSQVKELSKYGVEPLSRDFKFENFMRKASSRARTTIKQYLMDPAVIAGIGNIYSDEILFWAGVRPTRKVRSIKSTEFKKIYQMIGIVLKKAIKARGSSVGDFFKLDGTEGTFKSQHMVYGRYGEKCKKCGRMIERVKLGGRTSSFCPRCQI